VDDSLQQNEDVVARWAAGLADDMAGLDRILSPTARIWHSTDGQWLTREVAQRRMLEHQAAAPAGPTSFRDVRFHVTRTGGVVQAVVGTADEVVHIVQILTIDGGQIVALEEFIAAQSHTA
jgi:ketosteroid isomerase-like protein